LQYATQKGGTWKKLHPSEEVEGIIIITYNCNMSTPIALEGFIAKGKTHKVFTIILHTPQVTQATTLLEAKPKQIIYIGCE
jgi:hypothetical protein